jgi:GDPmannose 4,6-dehydratase
MVKKALITGINGQIGSYLTDLLILKGYEVHGIIRRSSVFNTARIDQHYKDWHNEGSNLKLYYGDLSDEGSLRNVIKEAQPDEIYNLGAQSHVKVSFKLPVYTFDIVAQGTLRLLESMKEIVPNAKFYQASSSEMFGSSKAPQNEDTPFKPCSPYGIAKVAAFQLAKNYRDAYNLHVSNGIVFNSESPRRGETFVTRKITRAVSRIKYGLQDCLYLGNLDAKRDWGYASDTAKAMWMILQQRNPDDYVIATGQTHTIRKFVEKAFAYIKKPIIWSGKGLDEVGTSDNKIAVKIHPDYYRPVEVDVLQGDATKARMKLGWQPSINFEDLVRLMMFHDLNLAERESKLLV